MPSSIAAARAALYDALVAAAPVSSTQAPNLVQVTFGPPDDVEDQEVIALLGIDSPEESAAVLGDRTRDEAYDLSVMCKAHMPNAAARSADPTGGARTTDLRGYALADVVRSVVRVDHGRLAGNVLWSQVVAIRSAGVLPANPGWRIFVEVVIRCRNRI